MLKDILQENVDEKYNCTSSQLVKIEGGGRLLIKQATKQWYIVANEWDGISLAYPNSTTRRWRVIKWKSATLTTQGDSGVYEPKMAYNPHTRDYQVNGWKWGKSFTLSAMDYAHPKVVAIPQIAYAPWSREFKQQWWKTDKSPTICARDYKDPKVVMIPQMVRVRKYEVDTEWLKEELRSHKSFSNKEIAKRLDVPKTTVDHWFRIDSCFAIPDENIWFKLKELLGITTDRFDKSITEFEERQWTYEKAERKIPVEWKMTTLTTSQNDEIINWVRIRKLTPIECERLQTLPDNYTEWVSDSQRYKMLWNWWTVDVVAHIFSFIK